MYGKRKKPIKFNKYKRNTKSRVKEGYVYIIKLYISDNEICYKIGYSINIMRRLSEYPFKVELIYGFKGTQYDAYESEQLIHKLYSSYRYYPSVKFSGYTETYSMIVGLKLLRERMICVYEV